MMAPAKVVEVKSEEYGTLLLKAPGTLGTFVFLEGLGSSGRDFSVDVIHHHLMKPKLNISEVREWPDELLLRTVEQLAISVQETEGITLPSAVSPSFDWFEELVRAYLDAVKAQLAASMDKVAKSMRQQMKPAIDAVEDLRPQLTQLAAAFSSPDWLKLTDGFRSQLAALNAVVSGRIQQTVREVMKRLTVPVLENLQEYRRMLVVPDLRDVARLAEIANQAVRFQRWSEMSSITMPFPSSMPRHSESFASRVLEAIKEYRRNLSETEDVRAVVVLSNGQEIVLQDVTDQPPDLLLVTGYDVESKRTVRVLAHVQSVTIICYPVDKEGNGKGRQLGFTPGD